MLLPMYVAASTSCHILFEVDSGNGSAMAVSAAIYYLSITFAALFGYLTTLSKYSKGLFCKVILLLMMFLLFVPVLYFSTKEFVREYSIGAIGGVSKKTAIENAQKSLDSRINYKLKKAEKESDTWNIDFDTYDRHNEWVMYTSIYVNAKDGRVDDIFEKRRSSFIIYDNGAFLKQIEVFIFIGSKPETVIDGNLSLGIANDYQITNNEGEVKLFFYGEDNQTYFLMIPKCPQFTTGYCTFKLNSPFKKEYIIDINQAKSPFGEL
jgi:hypothetical protein